MMNMIQKFYLVILFWGAWQGYVIWEEYDANIEEVLSRIPIINRKINKTKREKKQIKEYLRDIKEAKKNIELVAEEVENLQKKLPEEINDAENLGLIKQIAVSLNIKNIYLSPGVEENKGFYFSKRYELSASGTYLQILIFLEKIGLSERLLNIKSLQVTRSQEKQRGRFQIINAKVIIEAYRYNPNHREDRGIGRIEKEFKNGRRSLKNNRKTRRKKKR